ncbi:hypothetical protein NA56DRAFT_725659, partial [Hyaloscypha hepaticicola]
MLKLVIIPTAMLVVPFAMSLSPSTLHLRCVVSKGSGFVTVLFLGSLSIPLCSADYVGECVMKVRSRGSLRYHLYQRERTPKG